MAIQAPLQEEKNHLFTSGDYSAMETLHITYIHPKPKVTDAPTMCTIILFSVKYHWARAPRVTWKEAPF